MPIKVLIVDDSSFFRRRINEIIVKDPTMEVVGAVANGREAVAKVLELRPDVVTMDVEMPIMNGIDAVREIMSKVPTPIIMFSSLTEEGATATFNALDAGALDFITKNFDDIARDRNEAMTMIREKIKDISRQKFQASRIAKAKYGVSSVPAAPSASAPASSSPATGETATSRLGTTTTSSSRSAFSSLRRGSDTQPSSTVSSRSTLGGTSTAGSSFSSRTSTERPSVFSRLGVNRQSSSATTTSTSSTGSSTFSGARTPGGIIPPSQPVVNVPEITAASYRKSTGKRYNILAIGSSTGGPVALQEVLTNLPADFPLPIVLVQHMPGTFTASFAARLDKICHISVCEAKNNDQLKPGCAYLAPGGKQLYVEGRGSSATIKIRESEPSMCYRPCVDISFESINKSYGGNVLALILTGMGADGREGCRKLKASGATVWAQNEETSVIYGMPQAVVNAGIADCVVPLREFARCIQREVMNR